jgi:hypothetical protein
MLLRPMTTNTRSLALVLAAVAVAAAVTSCGPDALNAKKHSFASRHDELSTSVVISQVYGGGGNAGATYNADFVELFNRGTTAVNVTNWSVQYASATGTTNANWSVTSLGAFGMLQPGKYLLVALADGANGGALPTPNVTGTTNMSASAGKVALVNNTTPIAVPCPAASAYVDFVGFGGSNCSEGAPTAAISVTESAARRTSGCTETDSNSADFTVGAPTPRNNAVAAATCSTVVTDAGVPDAGSGSGDAGCQVFTSWPTAFTRAGYSFGRETTWGELHTIAPSMNDGGSSILTLEAFFGNGFTTPDSYTFGPGDSYGSCDICPLLGRNCLSPANCEFNYFPQGGTATVTTATESTAAGQLVGSLDAVKFVEWDTDLDEEIAGGECVIITTPVNLSWGNTTDGGTGGGTGGGGGATGGGAGGGADGGADGGAGGGAGGGSGGGGGTNDGGINDGGTGGGTGTGGGRGGFGGGSGRTDAGVDAGSGGGTGGGSGGGAGGGTGGGEMGGSSLFGGGVGGGTGGGGNKSSGCAGCSSDGGAVGPLLVMLLGALRSRRRK